MLSFHTLPGADGTAVARGAAGADWTKVCDAGQIARVQAAGSKCYYRPFLGGADEGDCGDGAAWAGEVWSDLAANGNPQPEAICFRNECNATVQTGVQYLRFRDTLKTWGYRGSVVLGSFPVGTPDWPQWADLKAGLAGHAPDAIDLHEYWDLTIAGSSPWYALRHVEAIKRGLLPAAWPVLIGECGSDGIWKVLPDGAKVPVEDGQGRRGWQDRGKLTADQQMANLTAYVAGCAPSVQAAFVFADGGSDPHWGSFHTFDTPVEAGIRAAWVKSQASRPPTPPKETTMTDWPIINQQTQPDNNDANDCGPDVADMMAQYLGIVPSGESVRQVKFEETGDANFIGYTTTTQMQTWFSSRGVPCVQVQTQDPASSVADALANGWPVAYLRYSNVDTKTGGHFVAAVPGQSLYTLANPWTGAFDTWTAEEINANSLGGWLVIVQQAKETKTVDPTLQAAALARCSALGVTPNVEGALFKTYARQVQYWMKNGQDNTLDPTPLLLPETVPDPTTGDSYWMLDSGIIWHWKSSDGMVYQAENKERASIMTACGWVGKAS